MGKRSYIHRDGQREIQWACGCCEYVSEDVASMLDTSRLCSSCYKRQQDQRAASINERRGLPPLRGTEAQIRWAEKIRADFFGALENRLRAPGSLNESKGEGEWPSEAIDTELAAVCKIEKVRAGMVSEVDSAKWWIEMNAACPGINWMTKGRYIRAWMDETLNEFDVPISDRYEARLQAAQARAEATVGPLKKSRSPVPVEVRVVGRRIELEFHKSDHFMETVRAIGFTWDRQNYVWFREIDPDYHGDIREREAGVIYRLLSKRYNVRCYDLEVLERGVIGQFEPEPIGWVRVIDEEEKAGWFLITWSDGDYFDRCRRLPGARKTDKGVCVPPESFEAVQDFVEENGFRVDAAAESWLNAVGEVMRHRLIERPRHRELGEAYKVHKEMTVEDGGIDESLRAPE